MTSAERRDLVEQALSRTLEDAAFVFTEPAMDVPEEGLSVIEAQLTVSGSFEGTFRLATTPELARELAANLLGVEVEDIQDDARPHDAVGEMLNILAGSLLADIAGNPSRYRIAPPQVRVTALDGSAFRHPDSVALLAEGGGLVAACVVSQP